MKTISSLDIFKHKTTCDIIIINYARDPQYGTHVASGPIMRISLAEFRTRGIEIVLENLKGFEKRDGSLESEINSLSQVEYRKFNREHNLVGIRQVVPSQLILTPMHPEKGGFIGHRSEELIIDLPCSQEQFNANLTETFERSG